MTNKQKSEVKKEYRLSEGEIVTQTQPLNSWEVAHLFYGVPKDMTYYRRDLITGDIIFSNKQ